MSKSRQKISKTNQTDTDQNALDFSKLRGLSLTGVSLHINFKHNIICYNAVRWPHIFRQIFLPKNLIYLHFQYCIKLSVLDIRSLPPLPWHPFLIGHPQRQCYISLLKFSQRFVRYSIKNPTPTFIFPRHFQSSS